MLGFILGCKSEPEPAKPSALERPYLRKLTVAGAKEVTLDHTARTIQIVFPATYKSDEMELVMELIDGVSVSHTDPVKNFGFRGFRPIPLLILNNYSQQYDTYTIYVDAEGEMDAYLREDLFLTENGTVVAPIVFTSGIGTVPERPSEVEEMIAWLGDTKNAKPAIRNTGSGLFEFDNAYNLVPSESIDLSFKYKEQNFQFKEKQKLTQWIVRVAIDSASTWWNSLSKNVAMNVGGGCFLPQNKYEIKLQNLTNVTTIQTEYKGTQQLGFKIPDNVKDGNYYVGIYEGSTLISKSIFNVANDPKIRGFQQVWTETTNDITPIALDAGRFEPIVSSAGKEINVNPYPMFTANVSGGSITADKLPKLRLSANGSAYELEPKMKEDRRFGDGAVVLYYAAYTLPGNIAPGNYAMRLNFRDGGVTEPFCKFLEIK
ncbi:hypothetical protein GCM10010967_12830 [Dyadobacter beijingensis]|uniref:Uncharacterized protein n=1 Tax=Dyadobacter beijingensis TaxID=365489 RepID=A0ABQ2HI73_9BACT|nr:hypothetical protein [Dyadobacter beijingensis]GGM82611.1 hypothetical protein GCM10010967_12830 [Dyadobacter beijingensis]